MPRQGRRSPACERNAGQSLRALNTREFGGNGSVLKIYAATQPFAGGQLSMKWDGEWDITIQVFRDLGSAVAAVLVLIFILRVGWFRWFLTPLVVVGAIPFSLLISRMAVPVLYFMADSRKANPSPTSISSSHPEPTLAGR